MFKFISYYPVLLDTTDPLFDIVLLCILIIQSTMECPETLAQRELVPHLEGEQTFVIDHRFSMIQASLKLRLNSFIHQEAARIYFCVICNKLSVDPVVHKYKDGKYRTMCLLCFDKIHIDVDTKKMVKCSPICTFGKKRMTYKSNGSIDIKNLLHLKVQCSKCSFVASLRKYLRHQYLHKIKGQKEKPIVIN